MAVISSVAAFSSSETAFKVTLCLLVRALRFRKYEKNWVSKGQIKTYAKRIFNTLEIHSRLLHLLILLVVVNIYLNLCSIKLARSLFSDELD